MVNVFQSCIHDITKYHRQSTYLLASDWLQRGKRRKDGVGKTIVITEVQMIGKENRLNEHTLKTTKLLSDLQDNTVELNSICYVCFDVRLLV